ncbi:MAG: LPS export ABC transporter periplasmic protein LptC [Deltaproteobacteria bacterium]|nr:LPS export ABC transporter periplasmic protein LptC [Deltaproteobacteria bacterium]
MGLFTVYLLSVQNTLMSNISLPDSKPTPTVLMTHVVIQRHSNGKLDMELTADTAVNNQTGNQTYLNKVFFQINQTPSEPGPPVRLTGQAEKAVLDKGTLSLKKNVLLKKGNDTEFKTELMEYNPATGNITAPEKIWFRDRSTIHQGHGMVYAVKDDQLSIKSPMVYR